MIWKKRLRRLFLRVVWPAALLAAVALLAFFGWRALTPKDGQPAVQQPDKKIAVSAQTAADDQSSAQQTGRQQVVKSISMGAASSAPAPAPKNEQAMKELVIRTWVGSSYIRIIIDEPLDDAVRYTIMRRSQSEGERLMGYVEKQDGKYVSTGYKYRNDKNMVTLVRLDQCRYIDSALYDLHFYEYWVLAYDSEGDLIAQSSTVRVQSSGS